MICLDPAPGILVDLTPSIFDNSSMSTVVNAAGDSVRDAYRRDGYLLCQGFFADEIALLDRGRVVFRGPNDDALRANPDSLYERIA